MIDPASVALKFAFLAVLYLFLLWISRNALKDLKRTTIQTTPTPGGYAPAPAPPDATGIHSASTQGAVPEDPRLVVERAPGHVPGMEYEVGAGAVMGRGDQAEIRLEDPFASSRHARLTRQGAVIVIEDLGSTNGTYLNEELLSGPQPLHAGDRVRIGDSEFTYMDR
jgi:pSer/pThr/pTyr-binding forkhead associated (FHA) protein